MSGRRWTSEEDTFLLTWHGAMGPDFIAFHDLGRPLGAGSRRLNALTKSGARMHFARMMYAKLEFEAAAGRKVWDHSRELAGWEREEAIATAAAQKASHD